MNESSDDDFDEPGYCVVLTFKLNLVDLERVRQWEQELSLALEAQSLGQIEGDEFDARRREMSVYLSGVDSEQIYAAVREVALRCECISEVRAVLLPDIARGDFSLPVERQIK